MAKKTLPIVCQVTPSSSQIAVDEMIIFFGSMPNICIFFQLPKLNKYCLGAELAPAHQVIKKLNMDHLWVYTLYSTSCRNGYRSDKKNKQTNKQTNKKGMPVTEHLIHVFDSEINIF